MAGTVVLREDTTVADPLGAGVLPEGALVPEAHGDGVLGVNAEGAWVARAGVAGKGVILAGVVVPSAGSAGVEGVGVLDVAVEGPGVNDT